MRPDGWMRVWDGEWIESPPAPLVNSRSRRSRQVGRPHVLLSGDGDLTGGLAILWFSCTRTPTHPLGYRGPSREEPTRQRE